MTLVGNIEFNQKIYNIMNDCKRGQQYVRAAGCYGKVIKQLGATTVIQLPSGKLKIFSKKAYATIGRVSKKFSYKEVKGKAGLNHYFGIRPTVRGTAMNVVDHPHGGKSGPSRSSVSP
jgi:large subunit ribosomal protein L2